MANLIIKNIPINISKSSVNPSGPRITSGNKSRGDNIQTKSNGVTAKNNRDIKLLFGSYMYLRQAFIIPTWAVFLYAPDILELYQLY